MDVYEASLQDCAVVELSYSDNFMFSENGFEGEFQSDELIFDWSELEFRRFKKEELKTIEVSNLDELLSSEYEFPHYEKLFLDAQELSHHKKEHDVAITLINTAFEDFLRKKLRKTCIKEDVNELPFYGEKAEVEKVVEEGTVGRHLLESFKEVVGINFKETPEYSRWYNNSYKPRIQIVHRGNRSFSAEDARIAFQSTKSFINHISNRV